MRACVDGVVTQLYHDSIPAAMQPPCSARLQCALLQRSWGRGGALDRRCLCKAQEVMEDPALAADGHSYERAAIEAWFNSGKHTSPKTGEALPDRSLVANRTLRSLISSSKHNYLAARS